MLALHSCDNSQLRVKNGEKNQKTAKSVKNPKISKLCLKICRNTYHFLDSVLLWKNPIMLATLVRGPNIMLNSTNISLKNSSNFSKKFPVFFTNLNYLNFEAWKNNTFLSYPAASP